jgi:hypothetical protein
MKYISTAAIISGHTKGWTREEDQGRNVTVKSKAKHRASAGKSPGAVLRIVGGATSSGRAAHYGGSAHYSLVLELCCLGVPRPRSPPFFPIRE